MMDLIDYKDVTVGRLYNYDALSVRFHCVWCVVARGWVSACLFCNPLQPRCQDKSLHIHCAYQTKRL